MFGAIMCNRNLSQIVFPFLGGHSQLKGISLDTLTYSAMENSNIMEAYQRAMKTRYVQHPHLLTIIDPQEIFLQRIIGEGTFGRVWSAKWRSASVAVKEFVFAQAAVAGRSSMQNEIVEEIMKDGLKRYHLVADRFYPVGIIVPESGMQVMLDSFDKSFFAPCFPKLPEVERAD